jgi:hypothetical protein
VYGTIVISAVLIVLALGVTFLWFVVWPTNDIPLIAETIPTTEPDEATTAALILLDGATNIRRDPGGYGSFHIAYGLTEKHPASNSLQQITSRLWALGWTPLKEDWLNPGLPSAHVRGWTEFIDGTSTPARRVHRWGAQWQDESGNIVDYTLNYGYPKSGPQDLQSLWINGSWYPAAGVKIMQMPTK